MNNDETSRMARAVMVATSVQRATQVSDPDPEFKPPWSDREIYAYVKADLGQVDMAQVRLALSVVAGA